MLKIVLREGFIHLKVCITLIKDNSKTDVILIDKKEHQMSINALIHALSIEGPISLAMEIYHLRIFLSLQLLFEFHVADIESCHPM